MPSDYPLTTDPKWQKFLAAFGKSPGNDRLAELRDAINEDLVAAGDTLQTVGPSVNKKKYVQELADLRNATTTAGQLPRPEDQLKALDAIKKKSAELRAKTLQKQEISKKKFGEDKIKGISDVESRIARAEGLQIPGLRQSIDDELNRVKSAYAEVVKQKDSKAFFRELAKIDTGSLQEALALQDTLLLAKISLEKCEEKLANVPDDKLADQGYLDAVQRLAELKKKLAELNDADLPTVRQDAQQFSRDADDLFNTIRFGQKKMPAQPDPKIIAEIDASLAAIKRALDAADNILKTCNVAAAKQQLAEVEKLAEELAQQRDDALKLGTPEEKRDALKYLNKPLDAAIARLQDVFKGVPRMLGSVADLLDKLEAKNKNAAEALGKELARLQGEFEQAMQDDDAGRKIAEIKKKLLAIIGDVAKVTKQDKYALLLEAQFGVYTESTGPGFAKNLKGTYEAMSMVPDSHVGQDKLEKVVFQFDKLTPYGEYGDSVVTMQSKLFDFTVPTYGGYMLMYGEAPFTVEDKSYFPNAFNITMLHEIGHSIDDKQDIMSPLQGGAGYGSWKKEAPADIAALCVTALSPAVGDDKDKLSKIRSCISSALTAKPPKKPDELSRDEWKKVEEYLSLIKNSREAAEPWYKPDKALKFGGRIYQEAYSNDWWSYDSAERAGPQTVSSYQWRAPGEFFACIYSVAWMKQETPPGLLGKFDEWMPPPGKPKKVKKK